MFSCFIPSSSWPEELSEGWREMEEICGEAAIYCDPMDVQSIAEGLTFLINQPEERIKLRAKGLMQKDKFDWNVTALKIFSILK